MVTQLIEFLAGIVIAMISTLGYAGIVLAMAIESCCIPLPSEVIMPFSGYLAFKGKFTVLGTALAGAMGCVLGSDAAWWIGATGGRAAVEKYGRYILLSHHDLDIADRFFARWGDLAIFVSRLLPVVRTFISLPAGIARMNFWKFNLYTFIGSLPWCYALSYVGFKTGENWKSLSHYFHGADAVIAVLLALGVTWFLWRHWPRRAAVTVAPSTADDAASRGKKLAE